MSGGFKSAPLSISRSNQWGHKLFSDISLFPNIQNAQKMQLVCFSYLMWRQKLAWWYMRLFLVCIYSTQGKFCITRMSGPGPVAGVCNVKRAFTMSHMPCYSTCMDYLSKNWTILNLEAHLPTEFQRSGCGSFFPKAQRNSRHPWGWGVGKAQVGPSHVYLILGGTATWFTVHS